jgi:MinD-like ATPase involved in chromosome partitioning or flagellar assembly
VTFEPDDQYRHQRAELLAANPGIETDPAEWGRRGRINQTLGMKLRPEAAEIEYRYDVELISRAVLPPWFVVMIANPKGGQGKTPTTLMVSYIFGLFRGAGVVAWDNTESKGTLADRAEATTPGEQLHVWDLLEHASELAGPNAQAGALGAYLRRQPGTMVDVLASDSSSKRDKAIGDAECDAVAAVLRRHRHGVFVDTAGEDLSDNWQWTAQHAHQLVIPMTYRRDAARAVLEMLDGLRTRHQRPDLVTEAVVAIAATPGSADPADRDAIIADLADVGITRIIDVPYEPLFEGSGTRIAEAQLAAATHVAYTRVAAEIAEQLSQMRGSAPIEYTAGAVPLSITRPGTDTGPRPPISPSQQPTNPAYGAPAQQVEPPQPYRPITHPNPPQGGNS